MSTFLVADAGPLIGMARAGLLHHLRSLYQDVVIPPAVLAELCVEEERPGSQALRMALEVGWLRTVPLPPGKPTTSLTPLDPGEEEALWLAQECGGRCRALLIDDRRGRLVARRRGLRFLGTSAVLLVAKERGLLPEISSALDQLAAAGYRLADRLRQQVLERAGET